MSFAGILIFRFILLILVLRNPAGLAHVHVSRADSPCEIVDTLCYPQA